MFDDIDPRDFLDFGNTPTDKTRIAGQFDTTLPEDQKGMYLTIGSWTFTISNPVGSVETDVIKDTIVVFDPRVGMVEKDYEITAIVYNARTNMLDVTVNIQDNPIPLFIIYGAVAGILLALGATSINSVLESVSKNLISPVESFAKSPVALGIILILLLPVISAFIGKVKK